MKHLDDNNADKSRHSVRCDDSGSSAFSGRRLDIEEDSPFSDLLSVYARSDQAQITALDATSGIFVREVAHYLGLAGPDLTIPYEFAPFTETVRRHSAGYRPNDRTGARSSETTNKLGVTNDPAVKTAANRRSPASSRKKDRGAGRRLRRERRWAREHPEPLPDFPAFKSTSTFNGWTHLHTWAEDISEYAALLGATTAGAYKHITSAMTLVHGLPKFHRRCSDGDFTIEHVDFVTRRCRDVAFRYLPSIDDYLADRRADITIETFKRSLALKIAAVQPAQETLEKVAVRRRVDISSGDDGTAYLTLSGPAPELHACYRRIEAFARSVYKGNTSAFGDQLNSGDTFDDERGIDALMFDIFTRTRPQLNLRITSHNTTTGATSSTDFPLDGLFTNPDGVPVTPEETLLDYIDRTFNEMDEEATQTADESKKQAVSDSWRHDRRFLEAVMNSRPSPTCSLPENPEPPPGSSSSTPSAVGTGTAFWPPPRPGPKPWNSDGPPGSGDGPLLSEDGPLSTGDDSTHVVNYEVLLDLPTHEYWLARQARTTITVPMLTLLGSAPECPEGSVDATDPGPSLREMAEQSGFAQTGAPVSSNDADGQSATANVCDLAGMLPDGSPLPADMARRIAAHSSTWTRILTDPATGTPLDAKAANYKVPTSIRQPLAAQWMNCTMPGCTRRAETTEVDHIDPFDHDNPENGGLTRFGNVHNLCRVHHQAKTDRKFSVNMVEPGRLEYVFKHGCTTEVLPPDNPINVEHARLFLKYFATAPPSPTGADPIPSATSAPSASVPTDTSDASAPATEQTPPSTEDPKKKTATHNEKSSPAQSQTAQPTTPTDQESRSPGWIEYVDPFSGQSDQNAKKWFWGSDEPPPF